MSNFKVIRNIRFGYSGESGVNRVIKELGYATSNLDATDIHYFQVDQNGKFHSKIPLRKRLQF
jgi:hypothetical protein